ncbi:hypothetical protein N9Y15_02475 [Alphaproteobacteria bacterium]|nr:hypothetical protein [Alphaproteobacteria bacterium]MDB2575053.1 hypothetical protein [Alphaproteobacteria bacterium]
MKNLKFNGLRLDIPHPAECAFDNTCDEALYALAYQLIESGGAYKPVIDADKVFDGSLGLDLKQKAKEAGLKIKDPSSKASNRDRLFIQHIIRDFFNRHPIFLGLFQNVSVLADQCIKNAELLVGEKVNAENFIAIKSVIDEVNRGAWSRLQDVSESQSGVSTLGTISETLLKIIFDDLVDDKTFFKVDQSQVQSYGDFVLMCLPNNLWLSVKSNFARERLLASGYTNDILGVGFFQDPTEFTSNVRIRNFQRAGFLAMYCPDVAVSEEQLLNGTNTFDEIIKSYREQKIELPTNINGKPFIRKLSKLYSDLEVLMSEADIKKRSTVDF